MLNLAQPGSAPVRITRTADSHEFQPAVSPDGTKIAFASDRDGDYDIYVMKAARESTRNVAQKLTRTNNAQNPILAREWYPDWSPDGKQLAFTRAGTELPLNWEIFRMEAAPEGRLNRAVNLTNSSSTLDEEPAWSPDGRKIAFVAMPTNGGDQDIYRMRATDGANRVNLTEDSTNGDTMPSWQPLP
jgi:Tol biopolymer transport system component